MDQIPLMPHAIEGVEYLKKLHELVVITARPDLTKTTTLKWLDTHFPNTFSDIVLTNQITREDIVAKTKGEVGEELGINAMIDDSIDNVVDCINHGIKGYLFSSSWNQDETVSDKIVRLRGWHEINHHF
jgi:5'(3')-deoxyribonucleotidase